MLAQRDYILEQVRLGDAEIEQLIRQVTGPLGVAEKFIGRDSPLRGILRR